MKDLEKLRKEQAEELRLAELTNKIETEHPELGEYGIELHTYISRNKSGDETHGWFSKIEALHNMTLKDVGMLLSVMPSDEDFPIYRGSHSQYENAAYDMRLHRTPNTNDRLEIRWKNNGIFLRVEVDVNMDCELSGWLKQDYRRLTESEISSYGIQKNRWNKDYREAFRVLNWNCGRIICYQGGYYQQASDGITYQIVEQLKYSYQFSEE